MISPVVVKLLSDLEHNEIKLLKWLLTSKCTDRQKILRDYRAQTIRWFKNPEYLTPLSQKQWSYLLAQYVGYKRYTDLLQKLEK